MARSVRAASRLEIAARAARQDAAIAGSAIVASDLSLRGLRAFVGIQKFEVTSGEVPLFAQALG
jgi:hypothetical protein